MARVLCVWELGTRLGHLSHLRLPIEVALAQGHQVFLAARELAGVPEVLAGLPVTLLQAPFMQGVVSQDQSAYASYTHLLAKQCFGGPADLIAYLRAWRSLFDLVQPDLVLFVHSPTALVTAHAYPFKKVLLGSGFEIPPVSVDGTGGAAGALPFAPFPTTRLTVDNVARLKRDDAQLLALINSALCQLGLPGLPSLDAIYTQADAKWLSTWPALDHFGARNAEHYLGLAPLPGCAAPVWPAVEAPRVFGYLLNFPSLPQLLRDLQAANLSALLYVRGLPAALRQTFSGQNMRFADDLVDLAQVAQQCAWVLHHGNHSTMATFMLAGVPQLIIPCHQEQLFGALRLVATQCAVMAYQDQPGFSAAITALQTHAALRQSAAHLARQCAPFDLAGNTAYVGTMFGKLIKQ
ncbi:MAG: hypothetical protein AUJ20_08380 [Comamonadaceae bacterium CG1_02_60_18]|nr:MAG: hypothetical protein AUJ20_08380 [Comamonadaceae bacterium CG1_02_60_18]PIQ52063.1 MAG: hypothetical protein COW02_11520 [Comamonadaceae bacterium CG12_big_fil_rev_8_21_14_0_65_59_15]